MLMKDVDRVIMVDWSIFLKSATYASRHVEKMSPTYTCMTMILANLKRIGITKNTLVLLACDCEGSWRKQFLPQTKGDRKEIEAKFQSDFKDIYKQFDDLLDTLHNATDWHICRIPKIEADDFFNVAARYYGVFHNTELVMLTSDSDMRLLWRYPNVKWFSPHKKVQRYKIMPDNFDYNKELTKSIYSAGHNNLGVPQTEEEYKIKKMCVDCILPKWIEHACIKRFIDMEFKGDDPDLLGSPTLIERYNSLMTDHSKIVTYEQSVKKEARKKKKVARKAKMKRELAKLEEM